MRKQVEQFDDDEMSEILRLAIRKQDSTTSDLRQRLMAAADELGISHEAIVKAEIEYRQESAKRKELEIYLKEVRNALRIHLGVYVIVNIAMAALNLLTWREDHEIWFPYIVLMWGIGAAIHWFVSQRKVDWDDEEFQKWRIKREEELG